MRRDQFSRALIGILVVLGLQVATPTARAQDSGDEQQQFVQLATSPTAIDGPGCRISQVRTLQICEFEIDYGYVDADTRELTVIGTMVAYSETVLNGSKSISRYSTRRLDGVPVTSVTVTGRCSSAEQPGGCERSFRGAQGTDSAAVPLGGQTQHVSRAIYRWVLYSVMAS